MGRFGPWRDVNSKASGKYERALYVESNSVCLQYTTVVFPSLWVSARRRLRAVSSAWAAASAACGRAAVAGASQRRCTDASAAEPCSHRCSAHSRAFTAQEPGCVGAMAVPLCEGKAGVCAVWFFSPRALSTAMFRGWGGCSWPGSERSWSDWLPIRKAADPAAPAGPLTPRKHPGMLGSLLALEMWGVGAGSMPPPCRFGTKFPWELMRKIKKCVSL